VLGRAFERIVMADDEQLVKSLDLHDLLRQAIASLRVQMRCGLIEKGDVHIGELAQERQPEGQCRGHLFAAGELLKAARATLDLQSRLIILRPVQAPAIVAHNVTIKGAGLSRDVLDQLPGNIGACGSQQLAYFLQRGGLARDAGDLAAQPFQPVLLSFQPRDLPGNDFQPFAVCLQPGPRLGGLCMLTFYALADALMLVRVIGGCSCSVSLGYFGQPGGELCDTLLLACERRTARLALRGHLFGREILVMVASIPRQLSRYLREPVVQLLELRQSVHPEARLAGDPRQLSTQLIVFRSPSCLLRHPALEHVAVRDGVLQCLQPPRKLGHLAGDCLCGGEPLAQLYEARLAGAQHLCEGISLLGRREGS